MVRLFLLLATCGLAAAKAHGPGFENLVVFGDSYSDEQTLQYLYQNDAQWPPPGTVLGPVNKTASTGGYTWPRIAVDSIDANLFNFAVSGGVCSEEIVYRWFEPIKGPFPGILEGPLPAFESNLGTEAYSNLTADNTVYGVWIGTNDLGNGAFLTDEQQPGYVISDFIDCLWAVFDGIYALGGRRFAILNIAPLEIAPQYDASLGINTTYFPDHTLYNMTLLEQKLLQYTTTVNTAVGYGVPFQLLVEKRWPGVTFSIFDVHKMLLDIHDSPDEYLEAPADVQSVYRRCNPEDSSDCEESENSLASFMWYLKIQN